MMRERAHIAGRAGLGLSGIADFAGVVQFFRGDADVGRLRQNILVGNVSRLALARNLSPLLRGVASAE
jgi:hypothetical protein